MKIKRFRSNLSTAQWGNRMWSGIAIAMVISNVLLAYHIITNDTREKTIVVPPEIEQPFSIQGDNASPEYLTQVGEWFASLALSYNPKNVDYRINVFLRYAAPESFSVLQTHLQEEAERIKRNEMSAMFFPTDAKVRGDYVATSANDIGPATLNQFVPGRSISGARTGAAFMPASRSLAAPHPQGERCCRPRTTGLPQAVLL